MPGGRAKGRETQETRASNRDRWEKETEMSGQRYGRKENPGRVRDLKTDARNREQRAGSRRFRGAGWKG